MSAAFEAITNSSQRYSPICELGRGAFSTVISATDRTTGKKVAIKRISHVFDDAVFAKHVLREVKMLRTLKHPNVVSIVDIVLEQPPNAKGVPAKWDSQGPYVPSASRLTSEQRIQFVSEQMDTDLHAVIQSQQPLSTKHLQYFLYQILQGVAYLHRCHILHRDLKPENILVNRDCHIKICDLGLARFDKQAHFAVYMANWNPFAQLSLAPPSPATSLSSSGSSNSLAENPGIARAISPVAGSGSSADSHCSTCSPVDKPPVAGQRRNRARGDSYLLDDEDFAMTERVVTRWYRAPEVILSMGKYSTPLDMWSVACIFAELALRRPLFPGKDFMEQLHLISNVLGKPTEHEINFFESPKARDFLRALPEKRPVPLPSIFNNLDPVALDLLSRMLVFDPRRRITAEEALRHPFFAALHRSEDWIAAPRLPELQRTFAFEQSPFLDLPMLRDLIITELRHMHGHSCCKHKADQAVANQNAASVSKDRKMFKISPKRGNVAMSAEGLDGTAHLVAGSSGRSSNSAHSIEGVARANAEAQAAAAAASRVQEGWHTAGGIGHGPMAATEPFEENEQQMLDALRPPHMQRAQTDSSAGMQPAITQGTRMDFETQHDPNTTSAAAHPMRTRQLAPAIVSGPRVAQLPPSHVPVTGPAGLSTSQAQPFAPRPMPAAASTRASGMGSTNASGLSSVVTDHDGATGTVACMSLSPS